MDKSCIIVTEEGKDKPRKLVRDFASYCRDNGLPVFIASYDREKEAPIMQAILPLEVGITDLELNANFDNFMRNYMILRLNNKTHENNED